MGGERGVYICDHEISEVDGGGFDFDEAVEGTEVSGRY